MITYERFQLKNGLKLLVHEDPSTPLAAFNILYQVGSRDETPEKTGFAHLFEHLMFGGTTSVPDFDLPIQRAGGENNAFTNNDITNFYEVLPVENIETAFWLESDRMESLTLDGEHLDIQKKVVIEEFKETCLNQPYGDAWHHLSDMAYKFHSYRWPVIGKRPTDIESFTLEEAKSFYQSYYHPNNAIVAIAGPLKPQKAYQLAEKWFGHIAPGPAPSRKWTPEPPQRELIQRIKHGNVPTDAIYMAFHIGGRLDPNFYASDLLSDILCNGESSLLYQKLIKEKQVFSTMDCYITGNIDPGLLVIEGQPTAGTTLYDAEKAIWQELDRLRSTVMSDHELQKWKNKIESQLIYSSLNGLNKAINLAYFEVIERPDWINLESEFYQQVTTQNIQQLAQQIFVPENCSSLMYKA